MLNFSLLQVFHCRSVHLIGLSSGSDSWVFGAGLEGFHLVDQSCYSSFERLPAGELCEPFRADVRAAIFVSVILLGTVDISR